MPRTLASRIDTSVIEQCNRQPVINERNINLANLLPGTSYRPDRRSPKCIEKFKPTSLHLVNRRLKRNGGPISNKHSLRNCSPLSSGKMTPSTRPSVTVERAAAPSAQPGSMQRENYMQRTGQQEPSHHHTVQLRKMRKRDCAPILYHPPEMSQLRSSGQY